MNVIWAFDPFSRSIDLEKKGIILLKSILDQNDKLEAVYVATNAEAQLATAFNVPKEIRYSEYPKNLMKKALNKIGLKKIPIEVLPSISVSLNASVKILANYAKINQTDFILLASNAKKTLPRIVLGSFAESLIHNSVTDILIYHQKTKISGNPPAHILYAHDFTPKGSTGLIKAMEYAKKWNAVLSVVHIIKPEFSMRWDDFESENFRMNLLKEAHKMERSIQAEDIKCKIHLIPTMESPSDTILSVAKKIKANIIVVTAKSGNLASLLGGSVTRKVLRESTALTLVLKV